MTRALLCLALIAPAAASAAPFTVVIQNTSPNGTAAWSTGLLTLKPLIGVGLTPRQATDAGAWATYQFANSHCETPSPGCTPTGCENGNATLLAQRWGLTLGTDAWLVPSLAVNGTATITFDAPVGSRLSYISWISDTSVFDDFVAMHPPGTDFATLSTMSVPLFNGSTPLENIDFAISGYDTNSTSPTDGSGNTCMPECPTATTGCYVAPGNASFGAGGTLGTPTTPAPRNVTAVSGSGQVRLAWSNIGPHRGVIIARRPNAAITWTPTNGTTYTLNQQVANQGGNPTTIIYVENGTNAAAAFTNTSGLSNGSRYFYKVFPFANGLTYGSGNVPSSQGVFSEPTAKTGQSPLWCYSLGFPTVQQPTTELGSSVYTASNGGTITANLTQAGASDGWEKWRPAQLSGAGQSRATLVPLQGRTGNWLITGDQTGRGYVIDSDDGAVALTTAVLGDAIQGQPVVQLFAYANAAFQAAHPGRDVIFFSTRNASTTNNKVYGVSSVTGAVVWTYAPGNLNIVNGGMAVDYVNNRLWVASAGTSNSVRVLSTLTGAQVGMVNLGAIDYGINLRFVGGVATEAVTITTAGTVYGIDLTSMAIKWSRALGTTATAWAFPINSGFIASVTNALRRWDVLPDAGSQQVWQATVPGANGITVDYNTQTLYVGGTGSVLRQLELGDGGIRKSLTMPGTTTTFGQPTLDTTAGRIHVGTLDGRLCAFPATFP
ncbi:MAG: hypothetical protein IPJ65_29845 [Archangiaceae bacterium]|nr:hypothetical protein [Archangiaceae bacterium]